MSRQRSLEKILESEYVTIGELVRITNSRYSTLKFYTEEGMLNFIQEDEKLTRRFKREEAVKRIEEIKELKRCGHRIAEIKNLLKE
ncbi:MerR family transcriptional regulator [Clostridium sartagoforme]|uniref:MerR family transcriptional regulator n=1 Tax=Clostridium sartagoforme TaxID=84031 RepID=A0A4S2DMZ9_9CLOT|nr:MULTISPECIES: MerR family transcriptional regulator [Clostridium]MBS5937288.1 MerR family transcriptional regulator [Clostridium sp.]TGY43716.1 MerR family transcriptional regulator [Clostridium sartagoforme]